MSRDRWLGARGFGLELLAMGVLLATLIDIAGTVVLLRHQHASVTHAVFVAVGAVAGGVGMWLCSGLVLEAIIRW
jgi:hypothetical protein